MRIKGLTPRERAFCSSYACSGNMSEAAECAGYENPENAALRLLGRSDIADEIARLCELKQKTLRSISAVGYQRLAFGSIADAVSLLYMESPTVKELSKMDLFSVSEIKRPKDGSMEIKFFDRLKALEKLSQDSYGGDGAAPFYDAIRMGALASLNESGCQYKIIAVRLATT